VTDRLATDEKLVVKPAELIDKCLKINILTNFSFQFSVFRFGLKICSKKVKKKLTLAGRSARLLPHTVNNNTQQHYK
jgi:hypothetical protein